MSKGKDKKFELQKKVNRTFSERFKRSKVSEIENKRITIRQVSELYGVSKSAVYKWVYLYSQVEKGTKQVVQMESEQHITLYYKQRLAELERLYGQKQLEVEYLKKAIELASEELGFDLKKKYAPGWSNGLEDAAKEKSQ